MSFDEDIEEFLHDTFFLQITPVVVKDVKPQSPPTCPLLHFDRNLLEKITRYLSLPDLYQVLQVCTFWAGIATPDFWHRRLLLSSWLERERIRKYLLCTLLNKLSPMMCSEIDPSIKVFAQPEFTINFFHPNDPMIVHINERVLRICQSKQYYLRPEVTLHCYGKKCRITFYRKNGKVNGCDYPPTRYCCTDNTSRAKIAKFLEEIKGKGYLMLFERNLDSNNAIIGEYCHRYPTIFQLMPEPK